MSDDGEDWHKRHVKANANKEMIAHQFAKAIRRIVRASVANDPYESSKYEAARELGFMFELIRACEEPPTLPFLVEQAVADLRLPDLPPNTYFREELQSIAEDGVRYFLELTSQDNFARGRQSQRASDLMRAIDSYAHERSRRG